MEGFHIFLPLHVLLLLICPFFALSHSTVSSLPGFPGRLPFHLETGYIGLGESEDIQLFYYFVKSEKNPKDDPVMLWLTGGPGCSAWKGLVYEIGPLNFNVVKYNGSIPSFTLNPHSWTKVASILFLDSPVGTGFSYSKSAQHSVTGDIKSNSQTYQFLRKWMLNHPEFLSNPVYIGGDSYSGKTVPVVVQYIIDGNEAGNSPFINIKGYVLGNPITDLNRDKNKRVQYAYHMGLISDEIYKSTKRSCGGEYMNVNPGNSQCLENLKAYHKCVRGINQDHTLEPTCDLASPKLKELAQPPYPCREYGYLLSNYWANDNRVRKALHINQGSVPDWERCNLNLRYQYEYDVESTYKYHVNLSSRGYRSLIYSGDHDMVIPFLATQAWIQSLNYSIVDDWRPWVVDGQVGGYTRTYSNKMTFATVKGGGHTAPEYQPKECYAMFQRWISDEPL